MFSVTASPFNSPSRSLYGGWAASQDARDAADYLALRARYANTRNAGKAYLDSKWANMALRFSKDAANRALAKKIKAALKGQLRELRQNQAWANLYNGAAGGIRSPFRRTPLSEQQKANIWATFEGLDEAAMTPQSKMWLSALGDAPYSSVPNMPQVPLAARQLLTGGPYYDPATVAALEGNVLPLLEAAQQVNAGGGGGGR